ncbi:MAG: YeeE/YedE family protein [Methanoregula sp.]|nr:YeeE/YedE family protein [Methanoregula sp.]
MTSLAAIRKSSRAQIVLGLATGILFGFLLQKGGVTDYAVIEGQLLLTDFTVLKVMLSAVIVGMIIFHFLKQCGYANLHAAEGHLGSNVIGGLIFGAGFALLGYCPGTVAGAVGTGALDALAGGMVGMLIGTGIFAESYPMLKQKILPYGPLPAVTVQEFLRLNTWIVIIVMEAGMIGFLLLLEYAGL